MTSFGNREEVKMQTFNFVAKPHHTYSLFTITYYFPKIPLGIEVKVNSEEVIVKK